MNGAELIIKTLEEEEVKLIYGLPGYNILTIYEAIRESNIEHVLVKHENAAAVMADVTGRLTSKPGICLVTAGPGALNSATGVAGAYAASSPMVQLTGHCSRKERIQPFHGVEDWYFLEKIFKNITKWSKTIINPERIPENIKKAYKIANQGRKGPVHLSFPLDLLDEEIGDIPQIQIIPRIKAKMELEKIYETIRGNEKPLIIAGKGVLRNDAGTEIKKLAEKIYAPIFISRRHRDMLPFHSKLYVGYVIIGSFTHNKPKEIIKYVEEADLTLTFGLEKGVRENKMFQELATKGPVIHIIQEDLIPTVIEKGNIITLNTPNLKETIKRLTSIIKERSKWTDLENKIKETKKNIEKELKEYAYQQSNVTPIHPAFLVQTIKEAMEKDAIITLDIGGSSSWMELYHRPEKKNTILSPERFGSMGFTLPAAIAAKKLMPNNQVIGVTGDGGILMTLGEMATAVEQKTDIKIIIMNDRKYSMIMRIQKNRHNFPPFQVNLNTPNFAEYAKTFKAKGVRIEDPKDLKATIEEAFNTKGPMIIDVHTTSQYEFYKYRV